MKKKINHESEPEFKLSTLYFNNCAELSMSIRTNMDEKERARKQKVLEEQMNLFLQAVIKDVNDDSGDQLC